MKKSLLWIVVFVLSVSMVVVFSLAGCKAEEAATTAEEEEVVASKVEPGLIGFSIPYANAPFYWAAAHGLKDEMSRMGYDVIVTQGNDDPTQQLQQIENFVTQNIQGGGLIVYDYATASPAIDKVRETGAPFFAIDREVSTDIDCFLITDNRKAGEYLAKWVIEELDGEKAYILKDYGITGIQSLYDRVDGFMDEMERSYSGNYEVTAEIAGSGGADEFGDAHIPLYKDQLLKNPEINVMVLGTDLLGNAAVTAQKELDIFKPAGEEGHIISVGVDGNPQTLNLIRNKEMTCCFSQYPYLIGVWSGIMLDSWIQGRPEIVPGLLFFGGDVVDFRDIDTYKYLWGDKEWEDISQ